MQNSSLNYYSFPLPLKGKIRNYRNRKLRVTVTLWWEFERNYFPTLIIYVIGIILWIFTVDNVYLLHINIQGKQHRIDFEC